MIFDYSASRPELAEAQIVIMVMDYQGTEKCAHPVN